MNAVMSFINARLRTLVIFTVLILAVYGIVSYNRTGQTKEENALASKQQNVRDETVQHLVQNGRLVDLLINTQNPDEDKDSPSNQRSLAIRKNAADSVNRLTTQNKITAAQSFETLFALCKDGDLKAASETGLTTLGSQNDANLKQIVDRLSNGDPDLRGAAVDVLVKIGGDKAAAAANTAMAVPAAQDSAISALQMLGAPSVSLLVAHLEDPANQADIAFRQQMVGILDQIAAPSGMPELIKLSNKLDQPSVQRQAQVALADTVLGVSNAAQAAKLAVTKAQDDLGKAKDAKAQADAQKAVTDAQTASAKADVALTQVQLAEKPLSAVLKNKNADSESRAQAALALSCFADKSAVAALIVALGDYDARVRDSALGGIQTVGTPAVGPLTVALSRGNVQARAGAAQALGVIGAPAAVKALDAAIASPATPAAVREGAAVGLGRSGNPAVIPSLVRALGDPDGTVASAASQSLLTPALEKAAIPALVAALTQPTPTPFNASETLSRMGALTQTDVFPALAAAIDGGSPETQTWAAVTLGELGSKDKLVLDALQQLSQSPDAHVQFAASQSLEKLKPAGA